MVPSTSSRSLLVSGNEAGSDKEDLETKARSRSSLDISLFSVQVHSDASRPPSASSYFEPPSRPPSAPPATTSTAKSTTTTTTHARRKTSRPYIDFDDDEEGDDDGAEADGEYVPSGSMWANVDGRRRHTQGRKAGDEEGRRKSMAV
jgi:hypothetical protein